MVEVRQLVGPYAGQIMEMEYAEAQACVAAGTAATLEDGDQLDPNARGPLISAEPSQPDTPPAQSVQPPNVDYAGLPALDTVPDGVEPLRLRVADISGVRTIALEGEWPRTIALDIAMLDAAADVIDVDVSGENPVVNVTVANGEQQYDALGLVGGPFGGTYLVAEIHEEEPSVFPDDWPEDDWKSVHHMKKKAVARNITGDEDATYSVEQAEEIIQNYLDAREQSE